MADEVAESSQGTGRMDLNLYLGLPPLPRPPNRQSLAINCPSPLLNAANSAREAARMDDTASFLALPEPSSLEVYSPSNALSMPEPSPFDPLLAMLSDEHGIGGEEPLDAVEPVRIASDMSSTGVSALLPPLPQPPSFTLLDVDDLEPQVEELLQPYRADPAARRAEMVSMRELMQPAGDIEAMAPELRLQRLIHLSERHQLVRPMPGYQRGTSPETDRLVRAITQSHSSLDTLRRHKPHGSGKAGGTAADHKEGCCGCEGSFECNICLDTAKEPVVTTCGHLFCWPCLYQWLHGHSVHSECPVCKGEVLEVDVTPIYGRGGSVQVACVNDIPPRPKANRNESLRQQLLGSDSRGIASMVRQLMENPDIVRAQLGANAGVEVTVLPSGRLRSRGRRQQRQDNNAAPSTSAVLLHVVNSTPESGDQVTLPSSNANDTAEPVAQQTPQQLSSMDQASASSTMAVIVGEVPLPMLDEVIEPDGRFRSPEPRRTRRRRQT